MLSSFGRPARSRFASSRTASRTLRLRWTQPSSLAPKTRSNRRCGISSGGSARSGPAQLMFFCMAPPNTPATRRSAANGSGFRAEPARQNLVDRGSGGAASGIARTSHHAAHRGGVAVERRIHDRRIIEAAENVHMVAQARQWGSGTASCRSRARSRRESSSAPECRCR